MQKLWLRKSGNVPGVNGDSNNMRAQLITGSVHVAVMREVPLPRGRPTLEPRVVALEAIVAEQRIAIALLSQKLLELSPHPIGSAAAAYQPQFTQWPGNNGR